jgi:hypothetical protein
VGVSDFLGFDAEPQLVDPLGVGSLEFRKRRAANHAARSFVGYAQDD